MTIAIEAHAEGAEHVIKEVFDEAAKNAEKAATEQLSSTGEEEKKEDEPGNK